MNKEPVPDTLIGPPPRLLADFFLPPRSAKSLNAAQIRITDASLASLAENCAQPARQAGKSQPNSP